MALFFLTATLSAITVDLIEPVMQEGRVSTEKGGIISGPDVRIQAMKIHLASNEVTAEGELMIEYGPYLFVGKKLDYDFNTHCGVIYEGKTGTDPWYFGGDLIFLNPDGSYTFKNAFATTCENYKSEWALCSGEAHLNRHRILRAKNIFLRCLRIPLFWLPSIKIDTNTILDAPLRYTFRLGGNQGPRVGVIYQFYRTENWKSFLRLDYRVERGLGGGLETYYKSDCHTTKLESINYLAQDWARGTDHKRMRYRFQGIYGKCLDGGKTNIFLSYDKLSDKNMATDYNDKGLQLDIAEPTEFFVRRQETNSIINLTTRVRINSFQSLKQELPTLSTSFRPRVIGNTGIITEGAWEASYLEFEYHQQEPVAHDYNSTRMEARAKAYRPIHCNLFTITPQVSGVSIWYGNNPDHHDRWVNVGCFRTLMEAPYFRFYGEKKHVLTPYLDWVSITKPTTDPEKHYIFDITDGWYQLNQVRLGTTHNLWGKDSVNCISRLFFCDLWTNLFYDSTTIPTLFQKVYARSIFNFNHRQSHTVETAWDFEHNLLDHINYQLLWTVSDSAALSIEYRHRSSFDWRKVDKNNFILDNYLTSGELRKTALSDRRDTLLLQLFWRFTPHWALQLQSRNGWRRLTEPSYFEYEVDLLGTIRSMWRVRVSYRHREDENRFFVNISLGIQKPDPCGSKFCPPCLF